MVELFSDDEIDVRLGSGWECDGDEIVRVYESDNYLDGVAFAVNAGKVAEEEFYHPETTIRYQEVEVRLASHGEGGIMDKGLRLADLLDSEL